MAETSIYDVFGGLVGGGLKMLGNMFGAGAEREAASTQQAYGQQNMYLQNALNAQQAQIARDFNAEEAEKGRYQALREQQNQFDFNAQQADIARQFSAQQQLQAEGFTASQSELNRAFQERMSSTAYQRSRADMLAAGLNPILAAGAGGASTPAGSAGSIGAVGGAQASGGTVGSGIASSPGSAVGLAAGARPNAVALLEGALTSAAEYARLGPSIDSIKQATAVQAEKELTQAAETGLLRKQIAKTHAEISETEAREAEIRKRTHQMGADVGLLGGRANLQWLVDAINGVSGGASRTPGPGAGSQGVPPNVTEGPGSSAASVMRMIGQQLDPWGVFGRK